MGLKKEFNRIVLDSVAEHSLTLEEARAAASSRIEGNSYVLVSYGEVSGLVKTEFTDCDFDVFEDDDQDEVLSVYISKDKDTSGIEKGSINWLDGKIHIPFLSAIIPYSSYRINHFIFTKSNICDLNNFIIFVHII